MYERQSTYSDNSNLSRAEEYYVVSVKSLCVILIIPCGLQVSTDNLLTQFYIQSIDLLDVRGETIGGGPLAESVRHKQVYSTYKRDSQKGCQSKCN